MLWSMHDSFVVCGKEVRVRLVPGYMGRLGGHRGLYGCTFIAATLFGLAEGRSSRCTVCSILCAVCHRPLGFAYMDFSEKGRESTVEVGGLTVCLIDRYLFSVIFTI